LPRARNALQWAEMPQEVRRAIERIAGAAVIAAENCPAVSPRDWHPAALANGDRVFAKALNGSAWPIEAEFHRAEPASPRRCLRTLLRHAFAAISTTVVG